MTAAIVIDQLTVRYGRFVAVDELDLTIDAGEVFGLIGPNGAGKSSTLRVLIGQRKPSAGTVSVLGYDVVRNWSALKPSFGYVPDRDNHFEELTGRRNLLFYAGLYRVQRERVDECLRLVELHQAADNRVRAYSLGMRRKLLLARALLHQPKVLYLDEPTANLDVQSAKTVHGILRDLAADGCAVLLTTHDMREVEELCDRVAIIKNGKRVVVGEPRELVRAPSRRVEVVAADGSVAQYDLAIAVERQALSERVAAGDFDAIRTPEGDFRDAFMEMTGMREEGS
jgi:ABC-2 type transport system ATP-binding protein